MDKLTNLISSKHTRSIFFLIVTALVIFIINGLLPTIEGKAHYTADPITMTYAEYSSRKILDPNLALTWNSENDILEYKQSHMDEEFHTVIIPDTFEVTVYTKFFFQHPFWYINTLTRTVSAILLFYSVFNYLLTKHKDVHKRYIELSNEMIDLSNNHLDPSTFEPWMEDVFNHKRKIAQHISNIKYRLGLLEKHTSYKIRLLAKKDPNNPKCAKYVHIRDDLHYKLTPEYITDVVVHRGVRNFKYIHPTFVLCGVNRIGRTTDSYSLIESDSKRLSKDVMLRAVLSTLLTIMFATLLTITVVNATDRPWYWVLIDILTTIAPLLLQIPLAYDYCNTYMEEHLITNLLNRRTIALLYLADMKGNTNGENKNTSTN